MTTTLTAFKDLSETERQEPGRKLVIQEIYQNASSIVSKITEYEPDEWFDLMGRYNYEEAARYHIESMGTDDIGEYLDDNDIKEVFDKKEDYITWKNQLLNSLDDNDTWLEFCSSQGIDVDFSEVYEHWIISDWLGIHIEEHGGTIERGFHGLTIWGRYTTGQAIALDYMIQKIAYEFYVG